MEQNLLIAHNTVLDLITKSQKDKNFKENFIYNPQATIESSLGTKLNLPKKHIIVVEDQSDSSVVYLNIPRMVAFEDLDLELTEEELEHVAGGSTPLCYIGGAIVVGACIYGAGYLVGRYM